MTQAVYLGASALFILGLKGLTHPRTALRGNLLGALGMAIVVAVCLGTTDTSRLLVPAVAMAVGGFAGLLAARRVAMTAMPQMVAVLNGLGGLASALVGASQIAGAGAPIGGGVRGSAIAAAVLIGTVTATGSAVAFAKLQGWMHRAPAIPAPRLVNALLLAAAIGLAAALTLSSSMTVLWTLAAVAAVLGLSLIVPIGGADMPVVVALLNAYSGLAAAAAGFALQSTVLVVSGSLVGASGVLLTAAMCRAMNRSLAAVLFGGAPSAAGAASDDDPYGDALKETTADEVALILEGAQRVVIVPGYGMAAAQAQHAVRDLMNALTAAGVRVDFAIHPVAGRMPGHMNVLLCEADVPYERLLEPEEINPSFDQVDVAVVVGANDIVNPAARDESDSPIAGMPILEVDRARSVIVVKRGRGAGFAGIANPLFVAPNALLLFGDGKKAVNDVVAAMNN